MWKREQLVCPKCGNRFKWGLIWKYECNQCFHQVKVGSPWPLFAIFWILVAFGLVAVICAGVESFRAGRF
jgi:hypothetical protein